MRKVSALQAAINLAKGAVSYLYEDDLDFVVGGCSDVAEVISEFLRRRGFQAQAVYGVARKGKHGVPFLHAWIDILGRRFDPVIWVQDRKTGSYRYRVDPTVKKALACDVEWTIEWRVPELEKLLT
jgi:hypothetical protein